MSLEDRIKHTGEHFLGSFDTDPALPRLIEERFALRMRRRRQRAAAGLGVGAVVVFGGLAVVNGQRGTAPPVAAPTDAPAEVTLVPTTAEPVAATSTAPTSMLGVTTTMAAVAETAPPSTPPPTVVAPIADGAPMLYTASSGGSVVQIDLSTGGASDVTEAALKSVVAPISAAVAASYVLAKDDAQRDRCGQGALTGPAGGTPLPPYATSIEISDDGSRGFVEYLTCPEPGALADGPPVDGGATVVASFSPTDPAVPLTPIDGVPSLLEVSADGRFLISRSGDELLVTDTIDGGTTSIVDGCSSFRADPATGFLLGPDGFVALAWCDGEPAVLAGPIGAVEQVRTPGCGTEADLAVRDDASPDLASGWFAVHDHAARTAWVVGPHGVSAPIPVGDEIAWYLDA